MVSDMEVVIIELFAVVLIEGIASVNWQSVGRDCRNMIDALRWMIDRKTRKEVLDVVKRM
jgi:hypothetical protein